MTWPVTWPQAPEERLLDALRISGGSEAVQGFVASWRQLFLDTLAPTHLPAGWAVDHRPRDPKDSGREAYRAQVQTLLCAADDGEEEARRSPHAKCPLRAQAAAADQRESAGYDIK